MRFLFFFVLLFTGLRSQAQVKLPQLVSDGMVLQRGKDIPIWGWAAPAEKVTVSFNGKTASTTTGADGKWSVKLVPMKEGGPFQLKIDASNHITINNILIGDVWLCSGQSNMVLTMARVKDRYPEEVASANNTNIRNFFVPTRFVHSGPQEDLPPGKWETATQENILRIGATAYFFAKDLYEKYHVPIGLINSSVGGSPVESWISEDALKAFPEQIKALQKAKDTSYTMPIVRADAARSTAWYRNLDEKDAGLHESKKWSDPAYTPVGWGKMQVPGFWTDQGLTNLNGVLWFRKEFDVPASMTGKAARLFLGTIVDRDSAFINGSFAGTTGYQYPPRKYDLPSGVLKPGKNTIVLRVINSLGKGGFSLGKPYEITAGDQTVDLRGEWSYKLGAAVPPLAPPTSFQNQPAGLYNAMIAPMLPVAIKGVIWYQGESNTSRANEYTALFSTMIQDWRKKFNQGQFPFLFVQLPNFMEAKKEPSESNWAELREAQRKSLSVPATAMAVVIETGEWNDLHPTNKKDVGQRLALAAEALAYADVKVVYSGPTLQTIKAEKSELVLTFTNTGSGLIAKGGGDLKYFAVAGPDKKYVWANAKIEKNKVIVWNEKIAQPTYVRYAWADNPEGANLYNKEGLPASPFQTDTTQNK